MLVNSYFAALLIAPLFLSQFPFLSRGDQPDAKQQITVRAKPAVVKINSGCGGEYYSNLTSERISYVYDPKQQDLKGPITGSGYFVNSDGYIITNAHMVESVAENEQKCKDILKRNLKEKLGVTEEKLNVLLSSGQIAFLEDRFFYYKDVVLPNANAEGEAEVLKFEVKQVGTSATEGSKDVAVIKVEVKDAPVLELATSGDLQVQDPIIVIGYPGAADPSILSRQSSVEATVTEGIVSNPNKKLQDGSPIIQVDVLIAPGSSGSPVLNQEGKVVGMISFEGINEGSKIPFAVPTSTIMEFIQDAGIENKKGKIDLMYQEGLSLFW